MLRIKTIIPALFLLILIMSCGEKNTVEKDIAAINVNVNIDRYDRVFGNANPSDLPKLKEDYPFMFPAKYPDSYWLSKMQDTLVQQLFSETNHMYQDFDDVEDEIGQLFQHLKYYYPEFTEPRVIAVVSEVDYRSKVIVTDTIALISLDTYLGQEHKFYGSIQKYLSQNFERHQIIPDLAQEYAKKYTYQPKKNTLLEEMIYHGKLLYFKDQIIPFKTDEEKMGYTAEQLNWAKENESEIWRYFVERELLYSTDSQLPSRFINPAPFSKFYLELDAESPGKLGQYIGWQIVRAYMNNTDSDLKRMLIEDAEAIFKDSKFKPRK